MLEHPESSDLKALKKKYPSRFQSPELHPSVFVAPGAQLHGDIKIGEYSSVWFNAVMRGDVSKIRVGAQSNIQDLTMVHESYQMSETSIGDQVTIGHNAIIHGCTIGNRCIIGMGAIVLDHAEIGDDVILGAGSLVTERKKIPSGTKAFGRPAKVIGELSDEERAYILFSAKHYVELARTYVGESSKHFS